jgi:hypothetical protein
MAVTRLYTSHAIQPSIQGRAAQSFGRHPRTSIRLSYDCSSTRTEPSSAMVALPSPPSISPPRHRTLAPCPPSSSPPPRDRQSPHWLRIPRENHQPSFRGLVQFVRTHFISHETDLTTLINPDSQSPVTSHSVTLHSVTPRPSLCLLPAAHCPLPTPPGTPARSVL